MKKYSIMLMLVFATSPVIASVPLNYDLAKKAVEISATVDAYGEYCEKPSQLGEDYIARFTVAKLEKKKLKELKALQKTSFDKTLTMLKTEKKECKDVQFLLKRLEIMRSLKDVSYEINGIDPATVKDNIPPLELLAPDTPLTIPPDDPREP